jgi:hypothetical protein
MSVTKVLDDALLKQLECPVCTDYMMSPITLCQNGHNICAKCRPKLSTCPSCGGDFLQIRNATVEGIAQTTLYPCRNREAGCLQILSMDNRLHHESQCSYKKRKCPFAKISKDTCRWTGIMSNVENHVRQEHSGETRNVTGVFKITLETLCASKYYRQAVFTLGKLFFVFWEIKDCNIIFAIFYVGPQNDAEEFTYYFKIRKHNEKISMSATCHSYLQDSCEILQPGECIALPYGTLLKYLSKCNDLSCEVEIRKSEDASVFSALSKWFEEKSVAASSLETSTKTPAPQSSVQLSQATALPPEGHDS